MHTALESIPFELSDPDDPKRILRGVIDQPVGGREGSRALVPVFILHGFKGFFRWGFFPELGRSLAALGFAAVRFNFSGSGVGADLETFTEDDAFEANSPKRECEDAVRVITAITGGDYPWIGGSSIGLIGHSMGGAVALLLAGGASPREVGAVVTWGAVATFDRFTEEQKTIFRSQGWLPIPNGRTGQIHRLGRVWLDEIDSRDPSIQPVQACAQVQAPTLVLHGSEDASVDVSEAHQLADALPEGIGRLELVEGAGHTFGATQPMDGIPQHLKVALARSAEHLRSQLL